MSTKPCPDPAPLVAWAKGGDPPVPEAEWEAHLSQCDRCRVVVDEAMGGSADSVLMSSLVDWKEEQETFLPTLRAVLASSFRARGPLRLEDFAFIESVDGDQVTGRLGNLELRELIGVGSMGAVFRAMDASLEREVAVKVLRPEYGGSDEIARLFLDEARAAAALKHENVLPIYDVARDPGEGSYYVMPFVEGGRLADLIREKGGLPPDVFSDIATKATRALSAAHAAGIVHRDVKPANILLEGGGGAGVWLADFGLARAAHHGFGEGSLVGTPGYVAPEIEKGGSGTVAADLYSLGAVFAEMWASRLPRRGEEIADFCKNAPKAMPGWLAGLIGDLLACDPAARPASAVEVLTRLESGLAAEQGAAVRREQAARRTRRQRRALAGMSGIIIFALLGDLASGHRLLNHLLRTITAKDVSVDGRPGTFASVAEALAACEGDVVMRLSEPGSLFSGSALRIEGRRVTLIGVGGRGSVPARARGREEVIEVIDGELHLRDLELRFSASGNQSHEGFVELSDAVVTLERCTLRQSGGASRAAAGGGALFLLRGDSRLEVREGNLITDRAGKGIILVGNRGSRKSVHLEGMKFAGGNLFQIVSSDGGGGDDSGIIEAEVARSLILATNPIRLGRDGAQVQTTLRSRKNLWQCIDVFLSARDEDADHLRGNFRFTDEDSLIAVGHDRAVEVAVRPAEAARQGRGDGKAAAADWATFWSSGAGPAPSVNTTQWVDWIVVFRPGRSPVWNGELPPGERGPLGDDEEIEALE